MTMVPKGAFPAVSAATAGRINSAIDFEYLSDYSLINDERNQCRFFGIELIISL
jgi:hypothetical protein